jgi:hypothetical protein
MPALLERPGGSDAVDEMLLHSGGRRGAVRLSSRGGARGPAVGFAPRSARRGTSSEAVQIVSSEVSSPALTRGSSFPNHYLCAPPEVCQDVNLAYSYRNANLRS